ncbi:hypothetical protein CRYUN_Cryun03dG0112000 [Craigia yunnanensis]
MDNDLEALWNKFSLTEDEKSELIIDKSWVEETSEVRKNCLLGKILTKHSINVEAMKNFLYNIWKLRAGLVVKEVGDRVFIFQFEDEYEKDRILVR